MSVAYPFIPFEDTPVTYRADEMFRCTCLRRLLVAAVFPLLAAALGFIDAAVAAPPAASAARKKEKQPQETAVLSAKTVVRADVIYGSDA